MIRASGLAYSFVERDVFADVDLEAGAGEMSVVVGPSGCGKTTLLRVLAGLLAPTAGQVLRPQASEGRVAVSVVFQDPRLLPWMTVKQNLAFAMEAAGFPRQEWRDRAWPRDYRARLHADRNRVLGCALVTGPIGQRLNNARRLLILVVLLVGVYQPRWVGDPGVAQEPRGLNHPGLCVVQAHRVVERVVCRQRHPRVTVHRARLRVLGKLALLDSAHQRPRWHWAHCTAACSPQPPLRHF